MNSEESSKRANSDLHNMIESWYEDDVGVPEGIYAGLITFLEISIELAPTKEAFNGMLIDAINEAHRRCNDE